ALADEAVDDLEKVRSLVEAHAPLVAHRIGQARVAVVESDNVVVIVRRLEALEPSLRLLEPQELPADPRLIDAVDAHGVVCRSPAEVVPPLALGVINVCAGIDELLPPGDGERHRQAVRMAVRGDA